MSNGSPSTKHASPCPPTGAVQGPVGRHVPTLGLLATLVLLVLMRMHAFSGPLETDECIYASVGERMWAGEKLYVDLWDHQPPGMFALTAVLGGLTGGGPLVYRWAATLAAAGTLLILHVGARQGLGRSAALLTAGVFAIASSDPGVAGEGCNRELYMNLLACGGVLLLLRGRRWGILGAGICLGLASLFKTVVAAQWLLLVPAAVSAVWPGCHVRGPLGEDALLQPERSRRVRSGSWHAGLEALLLFGLGPLLLWAGTAGYFAATERWAEFAGAVFGYNLDYSGLSRLGPGRLAEFFAAGWSKDVFRSAGPLWVAGLLGLLLVPWLRNRRFFLAVGGYALGSYLAVCLPGHFWPHYYLLMLPILALGAGVVFEKINTWSARAERGRGDWESPRGRAAAPALSGGERGGATERRFPCHTGAAAYAAGLGVLLLAFQFVFYLSLDPDEVGNHRYRFGPRMVWARQQGQRLAAVTAPGDSVYVCGVDAGIYYYGQRRCATRFLLPTMLIGENESAQARRAAFLEDLRRNRPRAILLTHGAPYIPELDTFIREVGYVLAGTDPGRLDVLSDPTRPIDPADWTFVQP